VPLELPRAHYSIEAEVDITQGAVRGSETIRLHNAARRPLYRLEVDWLWSQHGREAAVDRQDWTSLLKWRKRGCVGLTQYGRGQRQGGHWGTIAQAGSQRLSAHSRWRVCTLPRLSPCENAQVEPVQPSTGFLANATKCRACDGVHANRFAADRLSCTRCVLPSF
jgi:hypothetical protein